MSSLCVKLSLLCVIVGVLSATSDVGNDDNKDALLGVEDERITRYLSARMRRAAENDARRDVGDDTRRDVGDDTRCDAEKVRRWAMVADRQIWRAMDRAAGRRHGRSAKYSN